MTHTTPPTTPTERAAHIAAIRERHAQTTEGPWLLHTESEEIWNGSTVEMVYHIGTERCAVVSVCDGSYEDYDFIANARQDIPWLLDELERLEAALEGRQDWTGDDVHDAVARVRDASQSRGPVASVAVLDLRKLFVSADGVADSYSRLLEHTTGLTKPTTDPKAAITLADDRENERFRECLKDELAALATDGSPR